MKKTDKFLLVFEICFAVFVLLSYMLFIIDKGWIHSVENMGSDFIFRHYVQKTADKRIFIAAIDGKTTKALGYPLKRNYYATLINNLGKLGTKTIGMDIMFLDPSKDNPQGDKMLIDAVKKNGNVINLFATIMGENNHVEINLPFSDEFSKYSKYIASPHIQTTLDGDGHLRRMALLDESVLQSNTIIGGKECLKDKCKGLPMPSFAAAIYASYKNLHISKLIFNDIINLGESKYLNFRTPRHWHTDKTDGTIYKHISVINIIENKLTNEEKKFIKNGIALVGSTNLRAYDHIPSPFTTIFPGIEFHATAIDNLLHNDFLKPVNIWLMQLFSLILIFSPFFLRKYSMPILSSLVIISTLLIFLGNIYLFSKGIRGPFIMPLISLWISFFAVTGTKS